MKVTIIDPTKNKDVKINGMWRKPDSDYMYDALTSGGIDDPHMVMDRLSYDIDNDPDYIHVDRVVDYIAENGIDDESKREHLEKVINAIIHHAKESKNVELLAEYLLTQLNDLIIL